MAGYSSTPLVKKLGIKPAYILYVEAPPEAYFDWLAPMPENVVLRERLAGSLDIIHLFVRNNAGFERSFKRSSRYLKQDGMLWVSWPKKASGLATDLDENIIRNFGLKLGLVDVKVCAVDHIWSGLKFVIRKENRKR